MEEFSVTAATGNLGPVIVKLATLLGSQYKIRWRTRRDVNFIKSNLKSMHTMLWEIWEKPDLDAESKELKREAWDIAEDVDETVDDFCLCMERSRNNKRFVQTKIKESPFKDLKERVDDLSGRCRSKWKKKKKKDAQPISSLFSRKSTTSITRKTPPPLAHHFVLKDASELVGMDYWTSELMRVLVGDEESTTMEPQLEMALIVGMAGMGKTTLVRHFYEVIEYKFQARAFVSVTPNTSMKEVLTSILDQVAPNGTAGTEAATEEGHLIKKISDFLKDKWYLIIIDGLWRCEEWKIIRDSFPDNNMGSRIVTTTRIYAMADQWHDDSVGWVFHIDQTWDEEYERWVYDTRRSADVAAGMIAMKPDMVGEGGFDSEHPVVRMCGGVPLALVCMFSAVSKEIEQQQQQGKCVKPSDALCTIAEQVARNGVQDTPGFEPLVESLQLGFDDLPHHMLKTCLMYCSVYPENHKFLWGDFVRRWMAEGFVYQEAAAKGYLHELINRGLILVETIDFQGVNYIIHPIMRNFLRCKSREDNFISWSSDIPSSYEHRISRFCVEDDDSPHDGVVEQVDDIPGMNWSNIKSIVLIGDTVRIPLEKLERIRVLDLQCLREIENHHLKAICGLVHLRYLRVHERRITEIPPEIARLERLEILEVSNTNIKRLPSEIGSLHQLTTLVLDYNFLLEEIPREIGGLQLLKTLDMSSNSYISELPTEIGDLQRLENLDISFTYFKKLPREIGALQELKTLRMRCTKITELPSEIGDLQKLEILDMTLSTAIRELPKQMVKLQNLEELVLVGTSLNSIPREIGELNGLKFLELGDTLAKIPVEVSEWLQLPDSIQQTLKNRDLMSTLAREMLSFQNSQSDSKRGELVVGAKQMHIPRWIKEHFNDLSELDVRICKLEAHDVKILSEMPRLFRLTLRFEAAPREQIAITSGGFARLGVLNIESRVPRITFQEGAMPMLRTILFQFQFYGGPPNTDPMGIKHLTSLRWLSFVCNEWYRADYPCISATIDVVREEAQEHGNSIEFYATGTGRETFSAKKDACSSSEIKE